MEPENINQEVAQIDQVEQTSRVHQVTPLSKYFAMALFIILPFVGGYVGYTFAPEKIVEVESVVAQEVVVEREVSIPNTALPNNSTPAQCETDSDCMLVSPDCEDCEFAAIAVNELDGFRAEKMNRCELNPPEVMCDIVFTGEVKCIENSCQIFE